MPFGEITIPSIALTQLKAVTEKQFQANADVSIHYINHDFCEYLGLKNYNYISVSGNSNNSGFGDWFFAQAANDHVPDNTESYLLRYGSMLGLEYLEKEGMFLQEKRAGLISFLDNLIDTYDLANADIVGFTSMFMQNVASIAMAKRIKKRNNRVIVVMGGANCETPMGEELVKNFDEIDYVFSGTSLASFPKLIKCIITGNKSEAEVINGIFTKNNCANIIKQKASVLVSTDGTVETVGPIGDELSINEEIFLDYDSFLLSFERFSLHQNLKPNLLFETSRGCWWGAKSHCTFCGLNGGGMSYRAMKADMAINMLNDLFRRYGDRVKHYMCVDNILPREYITDVFSKINKHPDITIFYEVKADLTGGEIKVLSEAGILEMQPGIESLSTSTLKLMRKGTSAFNNIRFLQNCLVYSVAPFWNLLVGFPGEAEEIYIKYVNELPSLFHLPPPAGVFPVRFDRYSPYFMEAKKYGLDLHPLDYYSFNYDLPAETLNEMAYYFSDHNYGSEYIQITSKWIKPLENIVAEWKVLWQEVLQGQFPKLYFAIENEVTVIVDTRIPGGRKFIPSDPELAVLKNFIVKKSIKGLQSEMPELSTEALESTVQLLLSERFLFQENGTYMNLVFDSAPLLQKD